MHTLQKKLTPARSWGAVHTALKRQLKAAMLIVQSRQELEFVQDSRFDLYAVGTVRHHHSCLYFTESGHRQCLLSLSPGLSFYWSFSFTDHLRKCSLEMILSKSLPDTKLFAGKQQWLKAKYAVAALPIAAQRCWWGTHWSKQLFPQFIQIHLANRTITFWNLDKYILKSGQIHLLMTDQWRCWWGTHWSKQPFPY